jgi:NAD(P)H-dependent flavin oxidoreductase YrpB (nitropropane dioxygenase family)
MTAAAPEGPVGRLHTPLCELLGMTHPIVLGGMASGTAADLVVTVSNAGGLGILRASGYSATRSAAATWTGQAPQKGVSSDLGRSFVMLYCPWSAARNPDRYAFRKA